MSQWTTSERFLQSIAKVRRFPAISAIGSEWEEPTRDIGVDGMTNGRRYWVSGIRRIRVHNDQRVI